MSGGCLQLVAGCLGLALVFVWGCAPPGGFNRYFLGLFCYYWRSFYFGGGLGMGLPFYGA